MTDLEPVIGLEVHVELKTRSKIFCDSCAAFGAEENVNICPVCLGIPGSLPVLNKRVVEYGIITALALCCKVNHYNKFDRKHYFYPDVPKNYQISQFDRPLAENGYLEYQGASGEKKKCSIMRLHMEEDAGKLVHSNTGSTGAYTLVDYNRAGVPLLEIVSEPEIHSAGDARAYLNELKTLIQYLGVSDCKMEEGSLRCDANISLRPRGSFGLGTKTEVKNLNSFRAVQKALEFEIDRQKSLYSQGQRVIQETRGWDEEQGVTVSHRSKEEAHDYRYFPDPDLVPLNLDPVWVSRLGDSLPELPANRSWRYQEQYGLAPDDAHILAGNRQMGEYFEAGLRDYPDAAVLANWILGDLSRLLNVEHTEIENCLVTPAQLCALLRIIDKEEISTTIAKNVLEQMFTSGRDPEEIIQKSGLTQISSTAHITDLVEEVLEKFPEPAADYHLGKKKALGYLVGQVMKMSDGKANPQLVNKILLQQLHKKSERQ